VGTRGARGQYHAGVSRRALGELRAFRAGMFIWENALRVLAPLTALLAAGQLKAYFRNSPAYGINWRAVAVRIDSIGQKNNR
jgi:hypothetical protein